MFSKLHRFHGYGSLRGVYQRGRNIRGQMISLKASERPGNRQYRVAVVVSRKVSKSAVVRNRIRRRIYEQVRSNQELIKPSSDLVFTAYSDQVATLSSEQLQADIAGLLTKAAEHRSNMV